MKIARMFGLAAVAANLSAGHGMAMVESTPAASDVTVYVDGAGVLFSFQTRVLADRMLAAAGVRVQWRQGEANTDATGGLVIAIRFVGAGEYEEYSGGLSRAYIFGRGIRNITVLHSRVRATAAAAGVAEYRLSAHVLAHEIVHVLQGFDRHSNSGLMKAQWTRADYEVMARKTLPLTEEDVKFVLLGVEAVRGRDQDVGTK